jgi:predicted component of type VI protein secretion system
MALNVTLVVVGGDVKTPEVKLRLPSTVGRGRDCSIMLRHPLVSRQHCELFEVSGALMVRDLGSLNGTFVNNQRIEGDAPLQPGQLLTVGTVTFRAMYEAGSGDSAPPTTPAPRMKPASPSNETDTDGTLTRTPRTSQQADVEADTMEPVDAEMEFDLDDAKPLFTEAAPTQKPVVPKKPAGTAETVYAGSKTKPAPPSPPPPAAKPAAPPKPAEPVAAPAKAEDDLQDFGFLDAEEETAKGADEDDDLNDFLKNLK